MLKRLLISFVIVIGLVQSGYAATKYVGASATGSGNGSSTSNLCGGMADPDCTPAAGDLIYICGPWTTQIAPQAVNGMLGRPITYDFQCPGNSAILTFNGSADRGLFINGKSFLTINNANVTGHTGSGGAVDTALISILSSSNITLNDAQANNNTTNRGISIRGSSDVIANRPVTCGNNGHGIWITNTSTRITIDSFLSCNNTRTGVKFEGVTNQTLMTNSVASNGEAYGNGDGLYSVIADGITFRNNKSHDNTNTANGGEGYGIAVQQTTNVLVEDNEIYANRTNGIEVWGNTALSSNNGVVTGNKVYGHTLFTSDDSGSNGIKDSSGYARGIQITNNLVYGNFRQFRLGNDPGCTSLLSGNIAYGGLYSVYAVDSNEPGSNPMTGWAISGNTFANPASGWFYTVIISGNSNAFSTNSWIGNSSATYNGTVYTSSTIAGLDSTAKTAETGLIDAVLSWVLGG